MTQVEKIDYAALEAMLADPQKFGDAQIRPYLKAQRRPGGAFDPQVVPDPDLVTMDSLADFRVESAMRWGNAIARWRRNRCYELRHAAGEKLPVLVSEGDSWFQFPFLIDDVIDHLGSDHLIWSLDAAGDTAGNMVKNKPEYMAALHERRPDNIRAFLLSAAGNDIIGEDENGNPVLGSLLKSYTQGKGAAWHVDQARLAAVLQFLESCYRQVIATIRADDGFKNLPLIFHGYDYAFPAGGAEDERSPLYAAKNEWLGGPMDQKNITDPDLRRGIVRFLIDALYDMLFKVAGNSAQTRVYVVDVRGTLPVVDDWADEIHGKSAGFKKVADKFRATLHQAGVG